MKPILQALLIAEKVYREVTGKYIVCGTFTGYQFKRARTGVEEASSPQPEQGRMVARNINDLHQVGTTWAYLSLTEVMGETSLSLRYVRLKDEKLQFQCDFIVNCSDPLEIVQATIPLPPLPLEAGVHALELLHQDELLGSYRINVIEVRDAD